MLEKIEGSQEVAEAVVLYRPQVVCDFSAIRGAHSTADGDKEERGRRGLTAEEWVEEMDAARLTLAHDMKLDLIKKEIPPAM